MEKLKGGGTLMLGTICPNSTYNRIMLRVQTAQQACSGNAVYIRNTVDGYFHMYTV